MWSTGIGVDSKFPACQIQPVAGRFGQTEVSGFDLIDEGNRGCCTPGDGYFLRIGAGNTYFSFTEESVWPISFT